MCSGFILSSLMLSSYMDNAAADNSTDHVACAPSSFERYFREELPLLYEYLQEAPIDQVGWKDVIHWMWPLLLKIGDRGEVMS
ncbi:hypothetical protein LOK49_Contig534G00001 [Camellia lanceoleosa]|nr:hypothetical protein LOK49_Contig534G00001 [Camellia lanceoleosa]